MKIGKIANLQTLSPARITNYGKNEIANCVTRFQLTEIGTPSLRLPDEGALLEHCLSSSSATTLLSQ
uniref:Uncharacterized protein n=2 Tax=Ficus carica TaxID=3494 RepID=A0AA88EGX5_FICCA|nr:hypothetical protein TIFTF001_054813 [Ficus carica]GMN73030.1 hypothetical protein TIFTF001_054815 [Ficus carica]